VTRRATVVLVLVTVAVVAVVAIAHLVGGRNSAAQGSADPALPLASATTTASTASLVVAMGHLDDPANTFWQLFLRPTPGTTWRLETPPGVADNGGLVAALPAAGPLTAGFLTSAQLEFSPVAQSTDGGSTWMPGFLPTALVPAPDAMAVGSGGTLLALVATSGQTVLTSTGDPSTWHPLVTSAVLARALPACGVARVTAVAFDQLGRPVVGVQCTRDGTLGVLTGDALQSPFLDPRPGSPITWRPLEPSTPVPGTVTVLRLESTPSGPVGVDEVHSGSTTSLEAVWAQGTNGASVQSATDPVPPGWTVAATAVGGSGGEGVAVLLSGPGSARRIEVTPGPSPPAILPPGSDAGLTPAWTGLPTVPAGASAVATVGGEVDAFVVSGSQLTVWALAPGTAAWTRAAVVDVPLQYGSSS
jgi:hypothetical protein